MDSYTPKEINEKYFRLDNFFIIDHLDDLIHLVDYVPFSFVEYGAQDKRDDFLKSKNLLDTMQEMTQLITAKCDHYENPIFAYNSLLIEWLDCHPEFEGIISKESYGEYQRMKNEEEHMDFLDLFYNVKLPYEKNEWTPPKDPFLKDDSSIQLPNFKKIDEIYEEYDFTFLTYYLSYII